MLLKHSVYYLMANGLPGIVNFLAIAIYTRMLSPEEYGRYILVIAGVSLFDVVLFQWLRLSMNRFLPAHLDDPKPLLSTILAGFAAVALLTGGLGILVALLWPDPTLRAIILIAVPLLWALAWFEVNLSLSAIKLMPVRYLFIKGTKTAGSLFLGVLMILWGLGAYGPLLGLLVGMLLATFLWSRVEWMDLDLKIDRIILREALSYGLPLTATFALAFVVSSSDRFLIAWFLDEAHAGLYAAVYDLGQQSLTLLMSTVNLAAYPLAVRALEQRGEEAARQQLMRNATLLFAIAIPSATGLAVLAPNISAVLLGASFREDAALILPWVALAILLSGVRAFHFDLAFQLGRRTMGQVWVMGAAAALNIGLNFWWIPAFGLMGAAYATAASYMMAILLSISLGRGIFKVPLPCRDVFIVILSSLLMGLFLWYTSDYKGIYALVGQISGGVSVYAVVLALLKGSRYTREIIRRIQSEL